MSAPPLRTYTEGGRLLADCPSCGQAGRVTRKPGGLLDFECFGRCGADGVYTDAAGGEGQKEERKSAATVLISLARREARLFCDTAGVAYAVLGADGHEEVWKLRSKRLRAWLARRYFEEHEKAAGAQALQDAINTLEGFAWRDGGEEPVYVRVAGHGEAIYLDLADDDWQAVEVTRGGWRLTQAPPVRFRRTAGMLPLPAPRAGGSLDALRELVNAGDGGTWKLMLAWLVQALRPVGPYPVLELNGEQGTGKSTSARLLRALVDPNAAALRSEPREARDLMIAASNGWTVALDNVSDLRPWLSNALCRLATGGGFTTRTLYSDDDEQIFDAMRPAITTGIAAVADAPDLLDRALLVSQPVIPKHERRREELIWRDFERIRRRVLGALLDAVVVALGRADAIELAELPRMADFAVWAEAAAPALGWQPGAFLGAYTSNREQVHELALDSFPIVGGVRAIAEAGFAGTAAELLERLRDRFDEKDPRRRDLPKNASALGKQLRRIAPNLRHVGVTIEFEREAGGVHQRGIFLSGQEAESTAEGPTSTGQESPVPPVPPVPNPPVKRDSAGQEGAVRDTWDGRDGRIPAHTSPDDGGASEADAPPAPEQHEPAPGRGCSVHRDDPRPGCRYCAATEGDGDAIADFELRLEEARRNAA